jgi:hypothetical protein
MAQVVRRSLILILELSDNGPCIDRSVLSLALVHASTAGIFLIVPFITSLWLCSFPPVVSVAVVHYACHI